MTDGERRTDDEDESENGHEHDGIEPANSFRERVRHLLETIDDLEVDERHVRSGRLQRHGLSIDHEYELSTGLGDRLEDPSGRTNSEYHVGLVEYDDETLLVADLPDVDETDIEVRQDDGFGVVVDSELIGRVDCDGQPSRYRFHNGLLTIAIEDSNADGGNCYE